MSLPAADELFRTTGGSAVQPSAPQQPNGEPRVPAPAGEPDQERTGEHTTANEYGSPSSGTAADAPAGGAGSGGTGSGEHNGREQQASAGAAAPGTVHGRRDQEQGGDGQAGRDVQTGQGGQSGGQTVGPNSAQHKGKDQQEGRRALGRPAAQAAAATSAAPARGQAKSRQDAGTSGRRGRGANRRPSGRERHDEKITVYVSAEELMDLEHARLVLRGEHGLAVDRGRIVREAVAVVLADLESRGDASILVRRLRGR
ncbi:hypothetical protein DVA86_25630 [Streptomyces armeniacus]|uniref:Cobyrinic acid a,c-diamide synthase n=1 Tax=Streptomyces armeniacus TaxID=83291 RepID=A0A345XV62_9ACTN|nr:hypothetical protein [Streptomyces armeniacus]AXK35528.1 hypothetical protein DVA86_25630 [Streptomyces armeniacus]